MTFYCKLQEHNKCHLWYSYQLENNILHIYWYCIAINNILIINWNQKYYKKQKRVRAILPWAEYDGPLDKMCVMNKTVNMKKV